jgi:hypothetical protein
LLIHEPAVYFARTIRADDPAEYAGFLEQRYLPAWRALRADNVIESMSTVLVTQVRAQLAGVPDWNIVQIGRVPDGGDPMAFFDAEGEAAQRLSPAAVSVATHAPRAATLRWETLRTTPNSHSPSPAASSEGRRGDVVVSLEYIHVTPTLEALRRYQQLMAESSGPAMRDLVRSGFAYNFVPLETDTVIYQALEMPDWNQLHVMGMFPTGAAEFRAEFDAALRRANAGSGGFDAVFGEFDQIRTKPRGDLGRELAALRID